LDEGVLNPEAKYALTQLRLGSKLPSLHIPLPHGRGKQCLSSLFSAAGRGLDDRAGLFWALPYGRERL